MAPRADAARPEDHRVPHAGASGQRSPCRSSIRTRARRSRPPSLLPFQAQKPTADRDALRLLARLENDGPRRVGIEVRGEDAADLLPLLKGRRVILEPQMMELRFGDEPLRPRFDLELGPDGPRSS